MPRNVTINGLPLKTAHTRKKKRSEVNALATTQRVEKTEVENQLEFSKTGGNSWPEGEFFI